MRSGALGAAGALARRASAAVLAGLATVGAPSSARPDVVLHEYVPPDPVEDLKLGATTTDGAMAAAIDTKSGAVESPDLAEKSERHGAVYGLERTPPGSFRTYRIDGDTTRPNHVSYEDPFTPGIAPYKREFSYDTVTDGFELAVQDGESRAPIAVGGSPRPEDDQFYGDLAVDLTANTAVRIPSVGPGMRVIALRVSPDARVLLLSDGAENWFAKGDRDGPVRVVLHLAVDRAVFGSPFADVEWGRLSRYLPRVPDAVKNEGIRIARQIGVVDGTGPSEALRTLVKYFRGFEPSSDRMHATSGVELYREISTTKKGVCRHRAYAFTVTALSLGLPTRFVRNEAHAWVEVSDGTRFHRIDLGGAADELSLEGDNRVAHVPPRDPFEWPDGADSGQVVADRSRTSHGTGSANGTGSRSTRSGSTPEPSPSAEPDPNDQRPRPTVTVKLGDSEALRGSRVAVSGKVESTLGPCSAVRVDLFLEPTSGSSRDRIPLGALVTSDEGRYDGRVVVPFVTGPGDYAVRASTPGNLVCGQGQSP
ncbi:MAG TPA: transglutaminase domain-containing protein [Polyangiaceae bacterium]|nr:transglutaminase domain-containing protein [Polyangiaceae bacterium]